MKKYRLALKPHPTDPELIGFHRENHGLDSVLCCLQYSNSELVALIDELKLPVRQEDFSKLPLLDRLSVKYVIGAKKLKKCGTLFGKTQKSYMLFFSAIDRAGEKFVFAKARNDSPYNVESCPFTYDSVLKCLMGALNTASDTTKGEK